MPEVQVWGSDGIGRADRLEQPLGERRARPGLAGCVGGVEGELDALLGLADSGIQQLIEIQKSIVGNLR